MRRSIRLLSSGLLALSLLVAGVLAATPAASAATIASTTTCSNGVDNTGGLGLIRQFLSAPNHVARDLFESPEVQTWVGFWVAQLAGTGDVFGLGANYPVMVAGSMEPWGWAICKGGSSKLAEAMASFVRDHGSEIRVDAPVARIEVDADGARSVTLESGETIPVDGVLVSNLDPRHTFLELVGEDSLDDTLRHACERWRYDVMSMFCVYLALDAPVRWKAAEWEPAVERCFAVSVCESLDLLDDNASDCRVGVPPRHPGLFTVHPSLFDPSLCPPGKEACFCEQIAPYDLRDGGPDTWNDIKDDYAATVLDRWRPYLASGLEPEGLEAVRGELCRLLVARRAGVAAAPGRVRDVREVVAGLATIELFRHRRQARRRTDQW